MKVTVDRTRCTGLGVCESLAPDVFEVDEDNNLVILTEVITPELEEGVEAAVRGCPTEALRLIRDEP